MPDVSFIMTEFNLLVPKSGPIISAVTLFAYEFYPGREESDSEVFAPHSFSVKVRCGSVGKGILPHFFFKTRAMVDSPEERDFAK